MWTDGRYYLAAEKELEAGWKMEKMEAGVKQWVDWTIETIGEGKTVGWDMTTSPFTICKTRCEKFTEKKVKLKPVENLVDQVWGKDRPSRPAN